MSLAWYGRRLANMSLPELAHRGVEQVRRRVSRHRRYGWAAFEGTGEVAGLPVFARMLREGTSPPFEAALRASVADLLSGRFAAHGVAWPERDPADLFPPAVWRLDPVTGRPWPGSDVYCFDLKYRHARGIGDIKYVWDFNRLQFLQPLAAAACLWPAEPRPLAVIETAIESWAEANPPFGGLGWNSGIELALRAVTLVLVASLCGERLSGRARKRIAAILAAHLHWLTRFPSRFSSANNHRVAEALGEFVAAAALPGLPGAPEIVDRARGVLEAEAALQILPDGAGAEQSPTYAAFTAEMLLVADAVAKAGGRPLASVVGERLSRLAAFVGWLADRDGRVPAIGDDDEGRVLTLAGRHEASYPASIARTIAGHFGLPPMVAAAGEPELREALLPAKRPMLPVPSGLRCFESGGCTVVREIRAGRRMRLTVDHGPLGYLAIAAHGHADANAITLNLDDEDVLVDPGTFLYHSGGEWRDWFRGTRAHNTLTLDGRDQSTVAGPFNWSHKAVATLEEARGGEDWRIAARHDGYAGKVGAIHRRSVEPHAGGIRIHDELLGGSGRPAEIVYQLAPGLSLRRHGDTYAVGRDDGRALLRLSFSAPGAVIASAGGGAMDGGWVSPRFGAKVPAARLSWRGVLPSAGVETLIDWR